MQYPKVPKDILPTLVIGLGGTGYQVVKRLKQLFNKRYNTDKLPVRYLLIDTDLKTFLDDNVKNNEKCQLRFGEGIKNTLDWAYNNPNFEWLPQNPRITPDFFTSTDQGAGLVRPIGRMYLCKNAKLVYDNLQTAKNDLVDLHKVLTDLGENYLENIDRHKVYIVGSLAGGTGCGTFLDVAVMISKIFNRDNTNIIGMFTLESCYDDKLSSDLDAQNRSKANCYAALKELEFYMSSITNPEDKKYAFKYSNIGEIKLDRKLLDICYLIENKNEMGGVLTNIEDIYDLCSLQLYQEIGTTLGSQLRADYANFICKDKDPILKKDRHFSTFSSSSMEFPVENLTKYCSYMLAKNILLGLKKELDKEQEQDLHESAEAYVAELNSLMDLNDLISDFTQQNRLKAQTKYNDLVRSKRNLNGVDNIIEQTRENLKEIEERRFKEANDRLNRFVSETTVRRGIVFTTEALKMIRGMLNSDINNNVSVTLERSRIELEINNLETDKKNKKIVQGKENVKSKLITSFNSYIEEAYKKVKYMVFSKRYELVKDSLDRLNSTLNNLISETAEMNKEITSFISKIDVQSEKKYGGNIISREMITKDFYDRYFNKHFNNSSSANLFSLFEGKNLVEEVKKGSKELIKLCRNKVEEQIAKENIMDILKKSYEYNRAKIEEESKSYKFNDFIKNELDVTAKLAKPFWSAIKNPEVSWTECYYIGCLKGESNNGFTIKAPEAVDEWIRNQTGERSRWARYVETTNPYSIDVIHITMGACAAYLPDIKHYRQFYLKLLASKTYPLHLNEAYVGLEELDKELDDILLSYSLAKAYGAIIEQENTSYLNIRYEDDEYMYIYPSKYCLFGGDETIENLGEAGISNISISFAPSKRYKIVNQAIPENNNMIPSELELGGNYQETIRKISENHEIYAMLKSFMEDAKNKFGKNKLKEHCINRYIKDKVSDDFIARNKVISDIAAN